MSNARPVAAAECVRWSIPSETSREPSGRVLVARGDRQHIGWRGAVYICRPRPPVNVISAGMATERVRRRA